MPDEDKALWQLSLSEKRLLMITFVGGLASILVGAAIIGASLALARWESSSDGLATLVVLTVILILYASLAAIKKLRIWMGSIVFRFYLLPVVGFGPVAILWWIGIAVGVK